MNAVSAVDRLGAPAKTPKKLGVLDIPGFFFGLQIVIYIGCISSPMFFFCVGGWGGVNDLITLNKWFPNLSGSPNPK